jgi:outer membrane protein TolC
MAEIEIRSEKMRLFSVLAILISIFLVGEAASGERVPLHAFLEMVVSNNDMLLSEVKSVEAARFAARSSVAHQRASLGASAAGSFLSGLERDGIRDANIGGFEIKIEIVQPIDISGKFGLKERQAALSVEMRHAGMEDAVNSLLADAEERYWSAVFAEENIALQRDVLRRRLEGKRITERKYDLALVPRLDVIRADALVIGAEALTAQAETERLNILAEMALMAGGRVVEPMETLSVPSLSEDDSAIDTSIEFRPDVRAAKLALREASITRDLAAHEMSPSLEASASWAPYAEPSGSSSPQGGEIEMSLRLSIPILDGELSKLHKYSATARIQSAEASLKHIRGVAAVEITAARNNRDLAVVTELAKRSEAERSNEELRITELMYREGMGAQIDLINAHVENQRSRTEYLEAVKNMHVSSVRLRKAAGDYAAKFTALGRR